MTIVTETWSRPGYQAVAQLVAARAGLTFAPNRRASVEAGIRRAMARVGVADPGRYLDLLEEGGAALDDLLAELTVGETYFFREPAQLDFIRSEVLPEIRRRGGRGRGIRVWSAGCASGEEAYTVAILLHQLGLGGAAYVVGTDVARARLARASQASYTRWSLRGVPEDIVRRYFKQAGNRCQLIPEIRAAVEFRYLNLAQDPYPSLRTGIWGMDLILCRNVLIYLDAETVARVAQRLLGALSEEGWLFLGPSDPPLTDFVPCEVVVTGAGLAYRRPGRRSPWSTAPAGTPAASPVLRSREPMPAPQPPLPEAPFAAPEEEDSSRTVAAISSYYAARDYARAAELARREVERDGGDPALWVMLVRALANAGRLAEAGRACAAALERHSACAELSYLHALLLTEAGRDVEAAAAARRALYLDPRLAVAHLTLGSALLRLQDVAGAKRALENAERLLASMPPTEIVPAADGELAGRLAERARLQLRLVGEEKV